MSTKSQSTRYKFINDKLALFTETDDLISAITSLHNVLYSTPANPAGTTSTTGVMMGLGVTFTPKSTGNIKVFMTFEASNNTAGDGVQARLSYGTGAPPVNGAAPAGSITGQQQITIAASANQRLGSSLMAVITGLTIGTTYWFDILLGAVTGGTASILDIAVLIEEF